MPDEKPKREQPWAVRGVSPEAREGAAVAARRSGVTLGSWLDRVVRNAVVETIKAPQQLGPTQADMLAHLAKMMEGMKADTEATNRRLDEIAAKVEQPQAPVQQAVQPGSGGLRGWFRRGKP